MKNCSYCGRENSDTAAQCQECGTGLGPEPGISETPESQTAGNASDALARKHMLWGAFWCSGGVLVTLFTYLNAMSSPFGGTYIIAWGAILFGAVRFIQGWRSLGVQPSNDDFGYEALAEATRLEVEGYVQEALAAYQKVVAEYPATNAARDAQKSMESLKAKLG